MGVELDDIAQRLFTQQIERAERRGRIKGIEEAMHAMNANPSDDSWETVYGLLKKTQKGFADD